MNPVRLFFRNDDVNRMEPGLVEMTDILNRLGAYVSHAVEPANLTDETRDWLLERAGRGVEIITHGYSHRRHDRGEFGTGDGLGLAFDEYDNEGRFHGR